MIRTDHFCHGISSTEERTPQLVSDKIEMLRLPQPRGDRQARGADRREQPAQQTDGRSPQDSVEEQFWRYGEGKRDLAPCLKIHRGSAVTVEGEIRPQA